MLRLRNIVKNYTAGDTTVSALKGVTLSFRKNEFVSILGQSGCGKTTLLNVIGGLDQYTSGDLIINGKSTKHFSDHDWDSYRNHSIGFVFQTYNLIPHQTVLANVELALTLSGVSKYERRRRAIDALHKVGLSDQLHKKPNQMSGGQMQRVAIARALVNNPDILLADEPTGALDSTTSVQIMDLLREVAKDRLVIMVTHNPDLAQEYSTRIIRLLDGQIIDDSNPYAPEELPPAPKKRPRRQKRDKQRSMSFGTALSLSLNNLMTKKARTVLTSFAGSIGIIGIALILSVSTGVQLYIDRVQEDTLSSYPLTIESETVDASGLITSLMNQEQKGEIQHNTDRVYTNSMMYEFFNTMSAANLQVNNLEKFKKYLDNHEVLQEIATLQYSYNMDLGVYATDSTGKIVKSDLASMMNGMMETMTGGDASLLTQNSAMSSMTGSYNIWQELLPGRSGELIHPLLKEQYDVVYGSWPTKYDEAVLVINQNNEISDMVLFALGLKDSEDMEAIQKAAMEGKPIDTDTLESWSYKDICDTELRLVLPANRFQKQTDGTYVDLSATETGLSYLYNNDKTSIPLKISGILRQNDDAVAGMVTGGIGYTSALTQYVAENNAKTEIVIDQRVDPTVDVITGLPFLTGEEEELSAAEKSAQIQEYFATLTTKEKADLFVEIQSTPSEEYLDSTVKQALSSYSTDQLKAQLVAAYAQEMGTTDTSSIEQYVNAMEEEEFLEFVEEMIREQIAQQYAQQVTQQLSALSADQLAFQFDRATYTETQYADLFDKYMPNAYSESTYEEVLAQLGYVDEDCPSSINIYVSTFEDKDAVVQAIADYNEQASEDDKISYTDFVSLIMSSVSTIIDAISYVLIAFVAISLVVSSIMIGIITYISVLERTKEIGILRAIGASKKDISRVFNAETLIIGFGSGALGIGITLLLTLPINAILHALTDISILSASLPVGGAVILVVISMLLTFIAGLIPSGIAAKKDPVVALRTD